MDLLLIASQAGSASGGPAGGMVGFLLQVVLLIAVAWFFIFRPQQQRAKAHRQKIEAVKRGDTVVTGGGLMGKVTKVADDHVEIELAQNVRVRAVRQTLSDVVSPGGNAAND